MYSVKTPLITWSGNNLNLIWQFKPIFEGKFISTLICVFSISESVCLGLIFCTKSVFPLKVKLKTSWVALFVTEPTHVRHWNYVTVTFSATYIYIQVCYNILHCYQVTINCRLQIPYTSVYTSIVPVIFVPRVGGTSNLFKSFLLYCS